MARAQGARSQMAIAFESVYGTAPGSGYRQVPFASASLGGEQPLIASELLGFGRDPLAPIKDAFNADGDVVIPIDVENLGFWLKAAFGQPTTAASVAATGSITFSAQPAVNSTLTINGTVFTFVAASASSVQITIGGTLAATMTNSATILNAHGSVGGGFATYVGTATTVTITRGVLGPAGNTFTLAASTAPASNATVSGPTLTGGANSHTFMSGNWTLPSLAIETQMPEVPRFAMYTGCMLDQLSWQMQRSGLLTATAKLVAQGESVAAATAAGTPTALALQRFGHFNGSVRRNGADLGNLVSADLTYTNNLDRIETIRADGRIDGADPTMAALTGKIDVRFADLTLVNQAIDGTPSELVFAYSLGAGASFTFTAHAVYLPRPRAEISGPQGVQASFDWQAAQAASPARMCTAVLINSIASY